MDKQQIGSDPTIIAFQYEDACRQEMDAASDRCAHATDEEMSKNLESAYRRAFGRWRDAVEVTRAAHIGSAHANKLG